MYYRFDSSPEEDDPSMNLEVNFNKHLSLQHTPSDDDIREPLVISVTCKPQYRVSICGVHIVSDTRVMELYDTSEGYLKTSQGTQLRGPQDGDGGEETNTVYRCRARLEESQYGLTIKVRICYCPLHFRESRGTLKLICLSISLSQNL